MEAEMMMEVMGNSLYNLPHPSPPHPHRLTHPLRRHFHHCFCQTDKLANHIFVFKICVSYFKLSDKL
jgi:hypothetical protein